MKIIKSTLTVMLLLFFVVSCKNSKEEQTETMEAIKEVESIEETTEAALEVVEEAVEEAVEEVVEEGFSYSVDYPKDAELAGEVDATIQSLLAKHPELESSFENAYGYAVFPKITKAGLGIGGAGGKGLVFESDDVIGLTKLMQATVGFQAGGQKYSQVMFFENKAALDRFTNDKFKFSSEASAVALKSGASANVPYYDGIATVIDSEKGAMFEASLGTQKFKYESASE